MRVLPAVAFVAVVAAVALPFAGRHGCDVRVWFNNGGPYETFLDWRAYRIDVNAEHGVVAGIEGVF
jgi:hypothetical protein